MNKLNTINTDYLLGSRTIETISVSNQKREKLFFLYNYEGTSYRLFTSHLSLISFFQYNSAEADYHFGTEEELDDFLIEYDLYFMQPLQG